MTIQPGTQYLNILAPLVVQYMVGKQEESLSLAKPMGQQEKQKSRDEFAQLNSLSVQE